MSSVPHRLFSSPLRFSTRINLNTAVRSSRAALSRRTMSSKSHASHGGSDRPWMIGSALVFGPLFLYLVSPSARNGSHVHDGHGNHRDEYEAKHIQHVQSHQDVAPIADDEGTEVSGQEIKESIEKALEADSPKDAQEHEEVVAKAEMTVKEHSTKAQTQAEPQTETTLTLEAEPDPTPSAPVHVDEATEATGDQKAQAALEPATPAVSKS